MRYFFRNQRMNVEIHHFSIRLCVLSPTMVQRKCGVAFLHSWLGMVECLLAIVFVPVSDVNSALQLLKAVAPYELIQF